MDFEPIFTEELTDEEVFNRIRDSIWLSIPEIVIIYEDEDEQITDS